MIIIMLFASTAPILVSNILIKAIFVITLLGSYAFMAWNYFLGVDEKSYMLSILKRATNYS